MMRKLRAFDPTIGNRRIPVTSTRLAPGKSSATLVFTMVPPRSGTIDEKSSEGDVLTLLPGPPPRMRLSTTGNTLCDKPLILAVPVEDSSIVKLAVADGHAL